MVSHETNDLMQVCHDWKRKTKTGIDKDGFYMHRALKTNLDYVIKHVSKDWDFVIIVSGNGQVRIGKSVFAQQLGKYLSYHLGTPWSMENIIFDSTKLIEISKRMPKYSVVVYDEAREGLNNARILSGLTQNLLNYFAECGQLNQIFILVLPDFFDLPKSIAVTRSTFLINVYWTGEFDRGHFAFYNNAQKRGLYFNGKKYQNYSANKAYFHGRFRNVHTVDETEYRKKKWNSLSQKKEKEEKEGAMWPKKLRWLFGRLHEVWGGVNAEATCRRIKLESFGLIDVGKGAACKYVRWYRAYDPHQAAMEEDSDKPRMARKA